MSNNCCYCGSTSWGIGCRLNPMPDGRFDSTGAGLHVHPDDPDRCRFCGSISYGKGCAFNKPSGLHVKGTGGNRCVYCGSRSKGTGCKFNPSGIHDSFGSNITPFFDTHSLNPQNHKPTSVSVEPAAELEIHGLADTLRSRCSLLIKINKENVIVQILARYRIGVPLVVLGLATKFWINDLWGNISLLAACMIWAWPAWPFVGLILLALGAAGGALSRAGGIKNNFER